MADIIRLKSYETFMADGRSSVTYYAPSGSVVVGVIVGTEPANENHVEPEFGINLVNVDDVILDMARHIRERRKSNARNKAKYKAGKSSRKQRSRRK